jgi:hypothetical protein
MKALPISIVIEENTEIIQKWSIQKKELLHDLGVEAASYMVDNEELEEQVLIHFHAAIDEPPYADVALTRDNLVASLEEAEAYYVAEELYEKASIARNFLNSLNKK